MLEIKKTEKQAYNYFILQITFPPLEIKKKSIYQNHPFQQYQIENAFNLGLRVGQKQN